MRPSNGVSSVLTTNHSQHWRHLWGCMTRLSLVFIGVNALLWWHYDRIWLWFLSPIQKTAAAQVVILSLSSPFFLTLQMILWVAFCLCFPYILLELSYFVSPGLYKNERRLWAVTSGTFLLLFFWGQWFAWSCVVPWSIAFFVQFNGAIAQPMLEFDRLVHYVLSLQQAFFLLAAWPMILLFLIAHGVLSLKQLTSARGSVYVLSFVLGMLLTPPDCFAQCCVAVPMIGLYELTLLCARYIIPSSAGEK